MENHSKHKLEVISFTLESCTKIETSGAQRIELCDNPADGGTTPSYGMIRKARSLVNIELYPMIRPRGGDFLYTDDEFEIMKTDIRSCKELGCDGVVIGLLNSDGTVDANRCKHLTDLAYPMGVTFHRAFDRTRDALEALETIINCGCERILTSGSRPTATEGAELIAELVKAADERIIIMPGSGIRSNNIAALVQQTGASEFHTSARVQKPSLMEFQNPLMNDSFHTVVADTTEIKSIVSVLQGL